MKKSLIIASLALALCLGGCKSAEEGPKVMAREVPERADDFVFENNLIAGRFYGKALEGNPTSPGIDIWVKMPGKLVADEWYAAAQTDSEYYHHDHGGKDCYKVSVSLGGGASAPYIDGTLRYPQTNYRASEVLEKTDTKVVFRLSYPEWEAAEGVKVSLEKTVTVNADSYFCKVDDCYTFSGADSLTVAAGIYRHAALGTIVTEGCEPDGCYWIWEKASDQSIESEDGMLGVAVYVPGGSKAEITSDFEHGICTKTVSSGETFSYYFGSCWSKANLKTDFAWGAEVKKLTASE